MSNQCCKWKCGTIVFFVLITIILCYYSSNRTPSTEENHLLQVLVQRKTYADQIINMRHSFFTKDPNKIVELYNEAQIEFNSFIQVIVSNLDQGSFPIEEIEKRLPEAELKYSNLKKYLEKNDARIDNSSPRFPNRGDISLLNKTQPSLTPNIDPEKMLKGLNDIVGRRELFDRYSQQFEKCRWKDFPQD